MVGHIGIRLEDKNEWERRVPLTPDQVRRLVVDEGLHVTVQSSRTRAFADGEYRDAGAQVAAEIDDCPVVFAVKEIPTPLLRQGRTYMYFSHVIKGQPYNMPMLRRLMELGCTLIDYEKVTDDNGRRLIFFGFHAGLAGMIETLWSLGQRLAHEGLDTPFARIRHAWQYPDLAAVREQFCLIADEIRSKGLPPAVAPLIVGFTGYGNVSRGAQDVLSAFPVEEVTPDDLPRVASTGKADRLYKVVFRECHMAVPKQAGKAFDLQEYFTKPENFEGIFERHLPHLSVLVNCIYWTPKYPRLLPLSWVEKAWAGKAQPRLRVVGDVSCDVKGAIECTRRVSTPAVPSYVYQPSSGEIVDGVAGHGPVVMAVDNLPCELPRESSTSFAAALAPFVPALARADFGTSFEALDLPAPVKRAIILHRGQLTPSFRYLEQHLAATVTPVAGS